MLVGYYLSEKKKFFSIITYSDTVISESVKDIDERLAWLVNGFINNNLPFPVRDLKRSMTLNINKPKDKYLKGY